MTMNLRFGLADDGPNSWHHRKASVQALLREHTADFMCFQEVNDFQAAFLTKILKDYKLIGQRCPAPDFWQNNLIFYHSQWTCEQRTHFFLSPTPDIPSRDRASKWPRQCTMGMFAHADRRLICTTTHFDFAQAVQLSSARLIMKRLERLPHNLPTLVAGDFNATPDSPAHRLFNATQEKPAESQSTGFKNAFAGSYPGTYHDFTGKVAGKHIDWVLWRGALRLVYRKVIRDDFNGVFPSDHYPLKVGFAWMDQFLSAPSSSGADL